MNDTCTEETLLFQLISGLHASINMHVSNHFIDFKLNSSYTFPNHNRYHAAIGTHPDRVKNLFFLYAVVLRAINRAEPIIRSFEYETQLDKQLDSDTHKYANELMDITLKNCEEPFKEGQLFKGDPLQQEILLKEIQTKFYNISRILDCVSCEKCMLNGKLQIKGLGGALKLLFTKSPEQARQTQISRTELIVNIHYPLIIFLQALVNLLYKLSESLTYYEKFLDQEKAYYNKFYYGRWIVAAVIVRFVHQVVDLKEEEKKKMAVEDNKAKDGPKGEKKNRLKKD